MTCPRRPGVQRLSDASLHTFALMGRVVGSLVGKCQLTLTLHPIWLTQFESWLESSFLTFAKAAKICCDGDASQLLPCSAKGCGVLLRYQGPHLKEEEQHVHTCMEALIHAYKQSGLPFPDIKRGYTESFFTSTTLTRLTDGIVIISCRNPI